MKTLAKIAMIVLMSAGAWMLPQRASAQLPGITFQVFYDQLSPYGAWVNDAEYGYIWIPDESAGFFPYGTNGHWVFTIYGWTWVSDYPWGWATFHYGRWNYDDYYGWVWIPGDEWGPAWVTWRRCSGYYGWAPLGPNVTIQMTFNRNYIIPDDRWMFVRDHDFDRSDLDRHFIGRRENHDLIRSGRIIENTRTDYKRNVTYVLGPGAREVRAFTGKDIKPLPVIEDKRVGRTIIGKDQVTIYRPPVNREDVNGRKPSPGKIVTRDNIRPLNERSKGDLLRSNSNTNKTIEKKQVPPEKRTVPPKYERTDKINQNTKQQPPIETRKQGQNNQKQLGAPDNKTHEVQKQNNQKQLGAPDNKTHEVQKQNNQKQLGAPDNKTHEVQKQNNQKQLGAPDNKTHEIQKQNNQKQLGAPVDKTHEVQKQSNPGTSNGKVIENRKTEVIKQEGKGKVETTNPRK